jgi:glyoxylase-like metal-dependent hydrolase (beta-lactamase superfamily II)
MLRTFLPLVALLASASMALAQERPELPPGGRYFEDSAYSVFEIADGIWAIGEPTYYQNNFSFLLAGSDRALLLDGGANRGTDMRDVVASLTDRSVAVLPSHLHFDHLGGAETFDEVWLVDLPFTRDLADETGLTTIPVEVDLHDFDGLSPASFRVSRYVAPDEVIDLGGLEVQVLWTGGHTRDEIALWIPENDIMLTGDFIYPSVNFVGNDDDLVRSLDRLLAMTGEETRFFGAHGDEEALGLPEMTRQDLIDTRDAFKAVQEGRMEPTPVEPNDWLTSAVLVPINERLYAWADILFRNGVALNYE